MTDDPRFEYALRRNKANWDEYFREDRELARIDLAIARGARVMIDSHPGSQMYAEAKKQSDHYRMLKTELLRRRYP